MLPAINKGAGQNVGAPDVCLTPAGPVPVPVPYPNIGMNALAMPFSLTVTVTGVNAVSMEAQITLTMGDQPGTLSMFMGPGRWTVGNPKVFIEGLPAVNLTCPSSGNNMNNALGAAVVPSITNVFYTYAGAGPGAPDMDTGDAASPRAGLVAPGIGCCVIPQFSSAVPAFVYDASKRMRALGMQALILDLRGNRGGELVAALELAGDFLPEGTLLGTLVDADGDETPYRAHQPVPYEVPLVVVIDGGTASAAELFAGCLQAHGRARIAGARSYGKGTVQALVPRYDGSAARYGTVARFVLPGGTELDGVGVEPDFPLSCGSDSLTPEHIQTIQDVSL